jgi:hypothetical protein
MVSSLTKGVLNFPHRYMPKHVSGDTDVDTTLQNKTNNRVFIHGVVTIFAPRKTYLSVWAGIGIYDRKWPVQ